jgi:long-chain acyl-CoA synthetase
VSTLSVTDTLAGKRLVAFGGTGFLGKVWLAMVLTHFPGLAHVHMVVRQRTNAGGDVILDSETRFWSQIATSPCFDPLRAQHGDAFDAFLRSKVTPIPGDVEQQFGGVPPAVRDAIRGSVDALVNVAGLVDFNPPLDYALRANAFGMQNLVALAEDLGHIAFLHTSTCYVAGGRTGEVAEVDPREFPFPRADELDRSLWSAEREIAECVDLVEHVRHRTNDAFRQADFLDAAKANLTKRGEPTRGSALDAEVKRVRGKYEKNRLSEVGMERAVFWGWHNTYTYTKSIGEQVLAGSGLPFTLVRPAVIESAVAFPRAGWNEGINTTGPVIYLGLNTPGRFPTSETSTLDIIPVDHVAAGMIAALAELLDGSHKVVYQLGSSDINPLLVTRFIEIVAMYKRKQLRKQGASPFDRVMARMEPTQMTADTYIHRGPKRVSELASQASGWLSKLRKTPLAPIIRPAIKGLDTASKALSLKAFILDQFLPFMATHTYRFSTANVQSALARFSDHEQELLAYRPQDIDWRHYLQQVHVPGLEENCFPLIEAKMKREKQPLASYDTLTDLLDEIAERFDRMPALMRTEEDGLSRVSFADLRARALAVAKRLANAGVTPGDRVILSGRNRPEWPIAWFGVICAGAVVVPVDPDMPAADIARIADKSGARHAIVDDVASPSYAKTDVRVHDLIHTGAVGPQATAHRATATDLAAVLFTSGTTGDPKGVMLTHGNFTAILGSIGALFPLRPTDRVLSVLPLHHTFEFSCGLLLPLSRGSRILYLDTLDADRLAYGLEAGRITAMVGVPALWQLLERRIRGQVRDRGRLVELGFDALLGVNRAVGKSVGLDFGQLAFGSVHRRLGGHIRLLISGGAALPKDTHALFQGLGFSLAEGYGLTEAAPVLAVAKGGPGSRPGSVGKSIPGVTLRIANPDEHGIGEVQARGKNVMAGYFENEAATEAALDGDWLRTGDLGRLDHKGRLTLVGRAKDVVVSASGENIYLDDVEERMGLPHAIEELALVGLNDPRGGERLGLLAVPKDSDHAGHRAARAALADRISSLAVVQRPTVVHLVDAPLPRTSTRKVQRAKVREVLETLVAATGENTERVADGVVPRAVAAIAGVSESTLNSSTSLSADLGFDSLMWVELAAALDAATDQKPDTSDLMACETLGDIVRLVEAPIAFIDVVKEEPDEPVNIPAPLREPIKNALASAQRRLYSQALTTRVTGRAFIPQNRNVIVVSNHTSHLDMGLVKYALGPYGERIVGLAAQDYFFQGNKWWVAYFEQLTNLAPLDRESGFRASLDQARAIVDDGHIVLLFPEGTRRTDGTLGDFKPLVGKLALEAEVDILPIWLEGTHNVLPKGSFFPRGRNVEVRIGPPIPIRRLKKALADQRPADAARTVTSLAQRAVSALRDGRVFDPETNDLLAPPKVEGPRDIQAAFDSLRERLASDRVQRPMSWYFSLGDATGPRFTVTVDADGCDVRSGRPTGGSADCVVKTSAEVMRRIIDDAWLPGPPEFISGAIKTNEIPLVIEFARVFDLSPELAN